MSYRNRPDRFWGPLSLLLNGYRLPLPRIKQPEHEVTSSPPSVAKVMNEWTSLRVQVQVRVQFYISHTFSAHEGITATS